MISPEEFRDEMKAIAERDREREDGWEGPMHEDGDALLCKVLRELGYGDGVKVYERIGKWYA